MPKFLSFGKYNSSKRNTIVHFWDRFESLDKFGKLSLITMLLIIISTPFITGELLSLIQQAASNKTATINIDPPSGTFSVGQEFTVDLVIDGGGEAFNAAKADVTVSSNLTVKSLTITPISSGGCNFVFINANKTPKTSDPSFAGAILNGSSLHCNLYTLTLQTTATGNDTIMLKSGSVKSYADHNEILLSMQDGSYSIAMPVTPTPTSTPTPVPTNTPTPIPTSSPTPIPTTSPTPILTATPTPIPTVTPTTIPLEPPTINAMPSETYQNSILLSGSRLPTVITVFVNNSSANVIYSSASTWQFLASLTLGLNTFTIHGQDTTGNISTSTSTNISLHRLADINGDSVIDLIDLSIFGSDWDNTGTLNSPLSDMNNDGIIDLTDFSIIAKEYGN